MSEQFPSESAPPEEDFQSPAGDVSEAAEPARRRNRSGWIAPAWFFFGIIVGLVSFAAYDALIVKPAALAQFNPTTLRAVARDGVLDAITQLQGGEGQPAAQQPQAPQAVGAESFTVRPANYLGDPNAPITIFEFADYQCPYCKRYHEAVRPDLMKEYVETGKVSFVFKHSAFLGQESVWAAQAAECAADQGKFWDYHELLFARQGSGAAGLFSKENLMTFAAELGLDSAQFDPCLQNDATLERVIADTQEGRQVGVTGTPTFFINGQPLVGAQPLPAFQAQINGLLGQ